LSKWRGNKDKKIEENLADTLKIEVINAKGFRTIPKAMIKDRRLPIKIEANY
jgi:hypothetical protein